jgi:hypothetical protein
LDPVSHTTYLVTVNQQATPVGGSYGSVLWQDLGSLSLTFDGKYHLFPLVRLLVGKGGVTSQ